MLIDSNDAIAFIEESKPYSKFLELKKELEDSNFNQFGVSSISVVVKNEDPAQEITIDLDDATMKELTSALTSVLDFKCTEHWSRLRDKFGKDSSK